MCAAKRNVRFTPNSDRESEIPQKAVSALPPKADPCSAQAHVRFGPIADIVLVSFDDLVGAAKYRRRHRKAERLGGFEIDYQLVLGRRLHRQVGRLLALENAVDIAGRLPVLVEQIGTVGDEATGCDVLAGGVDRG